MKRGTEDLDFFIGDEAIAASGGPGELAYKIQDDSQVANELTRQAMVYTTRFVMDK